MISPSDAAGSMCDGRRMGGRADDGRIVDMQQHAYYQQHYHYYPYQQMLQHDEQEGQKVQGEERQ